MEVVHFVNTSERVGTKTCKQTCSNDSMSRVDEKIGNDEVRASETMLQERVSKVEDGSYERDDI